MNYLSFYPTFGMTYAIMLTINSTSSPQTHNEILVKWTTYHMHPHMLQPKLDEDLKVTIVGQ
jgi:hypothetical protein